MPVGFELLSRGVSLTSSASCSARGAARIIRRSSRSRTVGRGSDRLVGTRVGFLNQASSRSWKSRFAKYRPGSKLLSNISLQTLDPRPWSTGSRRGAEVSVELQAAPSPRHSIGRAGAGVQAPLVLPHHPPWQCAVDHKQRRSTRSDDRWDLRSCMVVRPSFPPRLRPWSRPSSASISRTYLRSVSGATPRSDRGAQSGAQTPGRARRAHQQVLRGAFSLLACSKTSPSARRNVASKSPSIQDGSRGEAQMRRP